MTYNKKSTRYYSSRQEREVAKQLKGRTVPNSGAMAFVGGDVTADNWLIECKTSIKPKSSFSIRREWLDKNKEEAFAMGKYHNALVFDFETGTERFYVVDEKTFLKMKEALDEREIY